ncbi:hypothetical protein [Legionella oakridgensis]|uniref:Dot/Icm secretion system substrate n=2 Tax=Legionella oakridgensis TaxID=29423 RepID=W0BCW5_9GAMM|nr:hypothetical protein [Legionella oakridgensis]AHE66541.1 hypothetical protein Loa_00985 [Legionella oakridgensis ATCC 33761 = DSM 21215]KTD37848.1 hypothetical protein Loak_1524 [Legionella oakridgensis]STY19699.1 Uncharacterised protein [Legionella longbeachae]
MVAFKKYTGNYSQVLSQLHLPKGFDAPNGSKTAYDEAVEKDLPRICYASYQHSVREMQDRLRDTSHQADESLSYTQGNFYGGVFTESSIKTLPKFFDLIPQAASEGTLRTFQNSIGFAFVDDAGRNCGISITYLRDDSNPDIPADARNCPFAVAIIRNTTAEPSQREVTYLSHPDVLAEEAAAAGEDLDSAALPAELARLINSEKISRLLQPLFAGESISLQAFSELDERIKANHNIDDRDYRTTLLQKYVTFAQTMPHDDDLDEHLAAVAEAAQNDVNFFKLDDFEHSLKTLFTKINEQIDAHSDDEETQKPLKLQNQLALYAIELELKASILFDEKQRNIKEALLKQAAAIQQLSEHPPKDKNFPTLVTETLQQALTAQKAKMRQEHQQDKGRIITENGQELIKLDKEKPSQPNFWQRNRTALVIGTLALLLAVSLALVLTGVLAPVGIALAAGSLASAIAIGLTATSGAFTIAAGAKIAYDETQFANGTSQYHKQLKLHEDKVQQCRDSLNPRLERADDAYRQKLQGFEVPFQTLSQELATPLYSLADQAPPVASMRRARSLSDVSLGTSREALFSPSLPRSRSLSDVRDDEEHGLDVGHAL